MLNKLTFLSLVTIFCIFGVVTAVFLLAQVSLKNIKDQAGSAQDAKTASQDNNKRDEIDESPNNILEISADDNVWGDKQAKVKIILYNDFECPFCAKFYDTVEEAKKEFAGRIAIVFRHYPLPMHKNAFPAALASECAAEQGKFWEMHDKLFLDNKNGIFYQEQYIKDAESIGLEMLKFSSCLDAQKYKDKIAAQKVSGKTIGVKSTPTFFINNQIYVGAYSLDDSKTNGGKNNPGMKSLIKAALEE